MTALPAILFATLAAAGAASRAAPSPATNPVVLDAKGDVARFYGIPMKLTLPGLQHYRYKVGHFSAEGDTYTFYTIHAQGGVEVDVQFDHGRLSSVRTSSPNALGPRGIGVGSPLSAVEAAWPEGSVTFGIMEHDTYVTFPAAEPGFMPNVYYYFDPNDMPPHAYEGEIWRKQADKVVPKTIRVKSIGIFPYEFPEATYDFLQDTTGPCAAEAPKPSVSCKALTPKRRYRGTLYAFGDTFLFAPVGKPPCKGDGPEPNCVAVEGNIWIRGDYDAQCPRLYQLEFIGRRNASPGANPAYRIKVDYILGYQELDDLPKQPASCARPWRTKPASN